jgi:hypothetical protein
MTADEAAALIKEEGPPVSGSRAKPSTFEIATAPFKEGIKEGAAAFARDLKAEWKPYLPLFLAFGLGVALARFILPDNTSD